MFDVFAFVQSAAVGLDVAFGFFGADHTFGSQFFGVDGACAGMLGDGFVHQRLGQGRVVALVVAEFAVADYVDYHIFFEQAAILQGSLNNVAHSFRIIAVHMEYRRFDHFGDVGAVNGGAGVAGVGSGKADLVVDNQVDGAAGGVAAGFRHIESCLVHAQADKGGVAVNQHRQNLGAAVAAAAALFGAGGAFNHGIDDFQMRGVERQRNVHRAVGGGDVGTEAHVVFHVAAGQADGRAAFKFGEQVGGFFAQGIDQHVQAAAVRHTDDDFFHAVFAGILDQVVQADNRAFAAFHAEAFLADIFGVQVAFQCFDGGNLLQDVAFFLFAEAGGGLVAFEIVANPVALLAVVDVHVFHTNVAAVGFFQPGQDVGQRELGLAAAEIAAANAEFNRHIGAVQPVFFGGEAFGMAGFFQFQRIQIGGAGTLDAVGGHQAQHADLFLQHAFVDAAGCGCGSTVFGQIGERFLNRTVGDIARHCARLGGQIAEILLPMLINRIGIAQKALVQFLDVGGIGAEQIRKIKFFVHDG